MQFLELCDFYKRNRGWASDHNIGSNNNYYLHIELIYYMFSPYGFWFGNRVSVFHVFELGNIGSNDVDVADCGVQFIGLCY